MEDTKITEKGKVELPGGPVVKNTPANAGDLGLIPGLGRFHMLRDNNTHGPQLPSLRAAATEAHTP